MKNTNLVGDIAQAKIIYELTLLGFDIYVPISDSPKADLVIHKDEKVYRVQCKNSIHGIVKNISSGQKYKKGSFDFYAVYLPKIDKVTFVPFEMGGIQIRYKYPESTCYFWWYEDFLSIENIDKEYKKRHTSDFNLPKKCKIREGSRDHWPSPEILTKLISEKPLRDIAKDYNVSDTMVKKWCKAYGIETKKRGFWLKKKAGII
jgi:hypothetical protein